jgi:hypothetical protein
MVSPATESEYARCAKSKTRMKLAEESELWRIYVMEKVQRKDDT